MTGFRVPPALLWFAVAAALIAVLAYAGLHDNGAPDAGAARELNVYSARHYDGDEVMFRRFTERTGIRVRTLQADADQLIQRIRREGLSSPADILMTVDAGRLWRAEQAGVLAPAESPLLRERIAEHLRHPQDLWFGFSTRMRVVFYHPDRIDPDRIRRYEDLAAPHLRGRICVRSSSNVYNQSLIASLLVANGAAATEDWIAGLMRNLARPPQGGDTDQIRGVAAGECDVALANHYYHLRLVHAADPADRAVAARVAMLFPNQEDRGVHVNVGGAGMVRGAPNPDNAVRFLEFLASDEGQQLLAAGNYEFPAVDGVPLPPALAALGEFERDHAAVSDLGRLNAEALRIADRAGWR